MTDKVELTTSVRFRRSRWWALGALLGVVPLLLLAAKLGVFVFLFPAPLFFMRGSRIVSTNVIASPKGLRVGERFVPRASFTSGLVRHEDGRVFVALGGRKKIDIAVQTNAQAAALLTALRLDAANAITEVALVREVEVPLSVLAFLLVASFWAIITLAALGWTIHGVVGAGVLAAISIALVRRLRAVDFAIGADGLVIRTLGSSNFFRYDQIRDVRADGESIVVAPASGDAELRFDVPARSNRETAESTAESEERRDEVDSIVRRIRQARTAFRERGSTPELSFALDRGAGTTREWLADLRKLGEGTIATFRTVGIAREQLLDIVEGTTANEKDRMAALVALRPYLGEEEKMRIRVAAERIAAPEMRRRIARVLDNDDNDDDEMIAALESVDRR